MKKILVIDDDLDILELMRALLGMNGFDVEILPKWEMIDPTIQSFRPDLVLLDISLNGADGRKICQHLKSDEVSKTTPVILFSANQEMGVNHKDFGAEAFIPKPFELSQLLALVNEQLANNSRGLAN